MKQTNLINTLLVFLIVLLLGGVLLNIHERVQAQEKQPPLQENFVQLLEKYEGQLVKISDSEDRRRSSAGSDFLLVEVHADFILFQYLKGTRQRAVPLNHILAIEFDRLDDGTLKLDKINIP